MTPRAVVAARRRKRVFDVIVGTLAAVMSLPFVLITATIAGLSLRAWPFFVQGRPGLGSSEFRMIKIRTLPTTTPSYLSKLSPSFADLDIPWVCRVIRRLHLDELPQLWLVPFGTMSIVGPRPRLRLDVEPIDPEFDRVRRLVRPGITGMWQVGAMCATPASGAPDYDLAYLRSQSLRMDVWIIARTFGQVLHLIGPAHVDEIPERLRGYGLVPLEECRRALDSLGIDLPDAAVSRSLRLRLSGNTQDPSVEAAVEPSFPDVIEAAS